MTKVPTQQSYFSKALVTLQGNCQGANPTTMFLQGSRNPIGQMPIQLLVGLEPNLKACQLVVHGYPFMILLFSLNYY